MRRRKREEGRGKKEEGRRKREEYTKKAGLYDVLRLVTKNFGINLVSET
ncbi:hypothetical protein IQ269_09225 [Tychonema sp. LEGE 07199]|nr:MULTISPECIES: hypothetical protein [unclassified Tychonema]MBE9120996.1 hypothetical protein [Tychonema sp. LEGE 07199]MBE9131125.1 hypothetical protein [Tychonema sp. LEGE 07196]